MTGRGLADLGASAALAAATLAVAGPALAAAAPPLPRLAAGVLSDERTVTRWAHAEVAVLARARPSARARPVARLRYFTEDGFPDVYLLLRRRTDAAGREWIRIRIARRPNGQAGWVPRAALGPVHTVTTALVVDRRRLRATLYRGGRPVWTAPAGVGKRSTPTPAGRFWIRERFAVPGRTLYGPYAFGTSAYSRLSGWPRGGVVGLHGTDEPWLVPGRPSHGCIRLRNRDIRWLARGQRLPVGTPLRIV